VARCEPKGSLLEHRFLGEQLGHFILGLLGQPRTLERAFNVPHLLVSYEQIINIFNNIGQRVAQNEHSLVSFKCIYYFASGRVLTVYDVASFRNFADQSLDQTIGVDINVTYLVSFPGSSTPEKQEIRLGKYVLWGIYVALGVAIIGGIIAARLDSLLF
jgi:hypothetical protein